MDDKMVVLTRFTKVSEAEILANLLKSEGVDCYVRDCFISQIYGECVDFGGVKVELLEKDFERATEIMKDCGYLPSHKQSTDFSETGDGFTRKTDGIGETEIIGEIEEMADDQEIAKDYRAEYERNKTKLSKTMTILIIVILVLVGFLIFLNKYFNGL